MSPGFARSLLLSLVALFSIPAFAGKSKVVDLNKAPAAKNLATTLKSLEKEKDQTKRYALALQVDQYLREKPVTSDLSLYDTLGHMVLDAALNQMAAPTDVFAWPGGDQTDVNAPRGDIFAKKEARVLPGRASSLRRNYIKTPQGKKVDRGALGQPAHLNVEVAPNEDEFFKGIEKGEFWGIVLHTIHVDGTVARAGVSFISPANAKEPSKHERPAFIGLFKQQRQGLPWTLVSVEPVTVGDVRVQDVNLITPNAAAGELEKKLRLAVAMEDVRSINPNRTGFTSEEERLFNLTGMLDAAELPLLEPYRIAEHPMVRTSAELKAIQLGATSTKNTLDFIAKGVKHPTVSKWLADASKKADDPQAKPALPDAGK